ncbi:MAG: acetate--CoA ligase family protein [Lautropia sp.]
MQPQSRHDRIRRMLSPRSIAIAGASENLGKINGRPLKHLLDKGYAGRILPINPKYATIAGIACHPSVAALPEAPDLAIVAVPALAVPACIAELGARGVGAAVVFSSGFAEMGDEGRALEARTLAIARDSGVVLCGPNCLGFINAHEQVYATFSQYADGPPSCGPIAFVTQSGAFGTAIAALTRDRGLGLGYFVNTGNEADLSFSEAMSVVIEDPRVRVAAGYLEGVRDGAALVRLAQRCMALGKPLVLTKVGRKAAGARAAASHTGALAVEDAVFDAVIAQYGVLRARNEEQMLDMLEALAGTRRAGGPGLGIATQSGGAGVMMADRAEEVGLVVPALDGDTRARLAAVMPAFGAAGNPVDITGQFVANPELLRESVVTLLEDARIDIGIVWLQLMTAYVDTLVEIFVEIRDRTVKPFLVCWVAAPPQAAARLRAAGIPVFPAGERAVEAAAALATWDRAQRRLAAGADALDGSRDAAMRIASPAGEPTVDGVQPTPQAVAALAAAGVPMAEVRLARSADDAVAAWRAIGGAVGLKIESPDITHKTEIGGVLLGIDDEAGVRDGFRLLQARAAKAAPGARIDGVIVQAMARGHLELVVGVRRDPAFGMIVMAGFGGILVEVLKDVAFRRAPFSTDEAQRMLADLRMAALFDGVRGQPPIDRTRLAAMLSSLSRWADAMAPTLSELDLNPVLVGPDGPVGVDCVMIQHRP